MSSDRPGGLRWLLLGLFLGLPACGEGPTSVGRAELEIVVAGGNSQFAPAGQDLPAPLTVQVRRVDTAAPREGAGVTWTVTEGDASFPLGASRSTDESGTAGVGVTLGTNVGTVRIRAELDDDPSVGVEFTAFAVDRPVVTSLSTTEAAVGDTITLFGESFSPVLLHNVVLFSGIRGRVVAATGEQLDVEVPACLPSRVVTVTAQLGSLVSDPLELDVEGGDARTDLEPRGVLDIDDAEGLTCLRLPGDEGAGYLITVTSASTVGAARYGFTLRGLTDFGTTPGGGPATRGLASPRFDPAPQVLRSPPSPLSSAFESELRGRESRAVARATLSGTVLEPARVAPTAAVPTVGERRTFKVLNADRGFDEVSATALYVGERAAWYVDDDAPAGGLTAEDIEALSVDFDETVHPTVTGAFGFESDLDGNERVVILFSSTVNELTPRGSVGYIGGFFYGLDLLEAEDSNRAEVFYAIVPDPEGLLSDRHTKAQVLNDIPAVLAHEFQHMVHFNERVLVREAPGTEALWLSEGMAQMAEELVALAFLDQGDQEETDRYREGNLVRARRYLASPSSASLIVATGQGSLAERGAGWLHTLYLWDRGGADVLSALTKTTRTGVANVTAVLGADWDALLADWFSALYLDGQGPTPYVFEYPNVRLRDLIAGPSGSYPLAPEVLGFDDFLRVGELWSSSAQHYIVLPPSSGSVALRVGGEDGAAAAASASLRVRVVRMF